MTHTTHATAPVRPSVRPCSRGGSFGDAASRAAVLQTRIHHIDSVVVRVLKARRRIGHQSLLAEVAKHLAPRFNVQPAAVKKRIESLMERDYLRRDPADRSTYEYVA